jgi:hypothetical protein
MRDLTPDDKAVIAELLRNAITADRYPLSPHVKRWRAILDKLEPLAGEPPRCVAEAEAEVEVEVSCNGTGSSEDVERLRKELVEAIRLGDDEGVRRAYRDLLRAGQPRKEIMDEVIRLTTSSKKSASKGQSSWSDADPDPKRPMSEAERSSSGRGWRCF